MERSPAEVSMGRHSLGPAEREQLRHDTTRRTSTTESYRARKRQLEKNPGRIWSVMSRSSLAIRMLSVCAARSFRQLLLKRRPRMRSLLSWCAYFPRTAEKGAEYSVYVGTGWGCGSSVSLLLRWQTLYLLLSLIFPGTSWRQIYPPPALCA